MQEILKELSNRGSSHPSELRNEFYSIFFLQIKDEIYLVKDEEEICITMISKVANITLSQVLKQFFDVIDPKFENIAISLNSFDKEKYLYIDEKSFIISFRYADIFFILKEIPFNETSYLELFNDKALFFGSRTGVFFTFTIDDNRLLPLLNFYQDGLQKLHFFKNKTEEF